MLRLLIVAFVSVFSLHVSAADPAAASPAVTAGEMVVVPAGTFDMGAAGEADTQPVHAVVIAKPFALGKYEVTFDQYDAFASATGRAKPEDEGWGRGNRPVINVRWEDASAYAAWVSAQTGKKYRLPSEAEWEYAARAGTRTTYPWGDAASHEHANYGKDECCGGLVGGRDQWEFTAPVGSFPANAFGLHDMHGNAWEWVQDCYQPNYEGAPSDGSARQKCDAENRVLRGGSYGADPKLLRSDFRFWNKASYASHGSGFRLAQDID